MEKEILEKTTRTESHNSKFSYSIEKSSRITEDKKHSKESEKPKTLIKLNEEDEEIIFILVYSIMNSKSEDFIHYLLFTPLRHTCNNFLF
jgi:hypothetical protein